MKIDADKEFVISDTCCLITFEKIAKFDLLRHIYKNIYVTSDVAEEYEKGSAKLPSLLLPL